MDAATRLQDRPLFVFSRVTRSPHAIQSYIILSCLLTPAFGSPYCHCVEVCAYVRVCVCASSTLLWASTHTHSARADSNSLMDLCSLRFPRTTPPSPPNSSVAGRLRDKIHKVNYIMKAKTTTTPAATPFATGRRLSGVRNYYCIMWYARSFFG